MLKLENGYNVGIEKKKVLSSKVIESFKEVSMNLPKVESKPNLKKISILHLGGTVASKVSYKTGGVVARFTPQEILALVPELKDIAQIETRLIRNMFSEDMRFAHYNLIAKEIEKEVKNGAEGIIVTHGTDTIHYSSAALSFMLENLPIPVILVGAQRSSDRGSSDAGLNLVCAASFIVNSTFKGVAVCMHESSSDESCVILHGCKVRKMHSSRRDAFRPINGKPVGHVTKGKTIELIPAGVKMSGEFKVSFFKEKLKIGFLKSHPNLSADEIKMFSKYDGVILEGTGLGHFPVDEIDEFTKEHTKILKEIKTLAKKIPVVMTTQCIFGRVDINVYESGRKLQEAGVLGNLLDMHPETAFIKLAFLLSNYKLKEVKESYSKNLRGEITERTEFEKDFL